jgi:DNA-binding transcriptional LysR family regulator
MEWQQLEYFRAVAQTEHFTKAAELLVISQPALSRSITKLEEELGVLLFDRLGRNVRLNSFGRVFLKHVERAIHEIHSGIEEINQLKDPASGTIALAFLLSLGLNILPDIIRKFNHEYPRVEFRLYQSATPFILKYLLDGEADLCLTGPVNNQPGISWHKLIDEELFAYLPADHRLARQSTVRLAELAAEPFISLKRGYGMRTLTETFCEQAGFVPQIKFEGDDVATIVGLVSSGLGVTLIPTFSGIDSARIKRLPISEPLCQREVGLAWQEERILSPSVELFRSFVMNQFDG